MKVLFVRSGNSGDDPISSNQGKSLERNGITVIYFDISGKGIHGYFRNIAALRKSVRKVKPDIIHAHYSLSGFVAALSFPGVPVGVALMGSDVNKSGVLMNYLIRIFAHFFWSFTIVKSIEMFVKLKSRDALIIPNGVDFDSYYPIDKRTAQENLGWVSNIKHVIFSSDPKRPEKNFILARKALDLLNEEHIDFQLHFLMGINQSDMGMYYNAADVLLLTSFYEGSPNVIKEAMACNCPIITTDVGDVKKVLDNTKNTFITSYSPQEIAKNLKLVLFNPERTDGRSHIGKYCSKAIAEEIIYLYKEKLKNG